MSQSDIAPPCPPLFVKLSSRGEQPVNALLTADSPFPVNNPELSWRCVAEAPNGRQVSGVLSSSDNFGSPYDRVFSLFAVKEPVELWFAAGEKNEAIQDRIHQAKEASIALWTEDGAEIQQENFHFSQPDEQPYWLAPELPSEQSFVIETSDSDGRPSFAVMRSSDRLMATASKVDAATPFALSVTSSIGEHTAYWSFFRHGRFEAAYHVAQRIIDRLPASSGTRTGCDATTLAAAHAIVRFGDLWEAEPMVSSALATLRGSLDAELMQWVFKFERGEAEELCRSSLRDVLVKVHRRAPIFTETFRLFYERMSSFYPLEELSSDSELRVALNYIERLMAASFLKNERLVYRGRSPTHPDADAPVSAGSAQKKSFLKEVRAVWFALNPLERTKFVPPKNLLSHVLPMASASLELPQGKNGHIPASDKKATPQRSNEEQRSANARAVAHGHARHAPARELQAKRRGGRTSGPPTDDSALVDRLVHINRVAKVVKGGRRFGFSALVVVGDQKGWVGFGKGKAREVPEAIRKATEAAKRAMIRVPLREGRTLHHDVNGHHGAGRVILRSAPAGTGIIAGGPMRAVFETLGIHDVVAKSLGSSNPYNMVRAMFEALAVQESPREVAARRNLKVSALVPQLHSRSEIVNDGEYATF